MNECRNSCSEITLLNKLKAYLILIYLVLRVGRTGIEGKKE